MMRCTSRGRFTITPLYILQALFLLLLFTTVELPCVNATANKSITRNVAAQRENVTAVDIRSTETTLIGCYPGIFLYDSNITYDCVVEDASMARGWAVYTLHYYGTTYMGSWSAKVNVETNTVSFVAGSGNFSGTMAFSIQRVQDDTHLAFVEKKHLQFVQPKETSASFTVASPYYGMGLAISTNLPTTHIADGFLLVGSSAECQTITANCNADAGCHDVTKRMRLPPLGTYHLCVTSKNWNKRYLPWGQFPLVVSALVSSPLYLLRDNVTSIKLRDTATGDIVNSAGMTMYLVKCESENCPTVSSQREEALVDVTVCDKSSSADRIYLPPTTRSIALPGAYALCVEDAAGGYVSPTALAMTVVQQPFAMDVVSAFHDVVKVNVKGGDIDIRKERYAVCIVEEGDLCTSVSIEGEQCTWSTHPNSDSVDVNVSKVSPGNVTLCLIAKSFTFGGRTYMEVVAEEKYVLKDGRGKGSKWIWIVIIVAVVCVLLLFGAVAVLCYLRRKKKQISESNSLDEYYIPDLYRNEPVEYNSLNSARHDVDANFDHGGMAPCDIRSSCSFSGRSIEECEGH